MAMNQMAAGGPVGGMMMMNNGSPAQMSNAGNDMVKVQLNTYIYEYFLKLGHYDIARVLAKDDKFEVRTVPKQSPGQRRGVEVNGDTGEGMDVDLKDDIPDDLPRPPQMDLGPGNGFLFEWFSIFSDLFSAHLRGQKGINGQVTPAQQYLLQHQQMQRIRENQQNQNLNRPGMVNPAMMRGVRNPMVNGDMARNMPNNLTPQQLQALQNQKQKQLQMQQQMQRGEQPEGEMNGRPGTPADGDNGGSPSKRPRLDGQQQFANGMMPNGRPGGVPGVGPQGMMIQSGFQPNMNQAQFRQNGAMPQKAMQAGMANGMMNMGGAGSPMMQNMNQFPDNMQMDMYQQGRMPNQAMQGAPGSQSGNHALQDYQMQLMLLEQQNKKRLMMARQEQHENNPREGGPMQGVGMQPPGMSPSGSRSGTSPNPTDQIKRTPQLGGLPGSPSAGDAMQGRSPAGMGFMNVNGMQPQDFNSAMFIKNDQAMMGPGAPPGMRPPTSAVDMNAIARQQQQGRMNNQFQGGQPMAQQASQGGQQPMGTPGQRNEMPPPQAPAGGNSAQRNNQPASPANSNAPPTPSQASKPNPKTKKGKEEPNKKRPTKKNSTANAPASDDNPAAATPTPSTPINNAGGQNFNASAGKGPAGGMQQANQQTPQNPTLQNTPQQMGQDLGQPSYNEFAAPDTGFNLDFSTLENTDVLENFDFDSFLNTSADENFNFDASMGIGAELNFDSHE